jgi:hypothetical protein
MTIHRLDGETGCGWRPASPETIVRTIGPPTVKTIYDSPHSGQTFAAIG